MKLAPEVDLTKVAARTAGFAGADLANLVNEAALLAARHDKQSVEMADFDEAIDRLIAGLEKKRVINEKEREIIAYHESGHAIVASALPGMDPVHKISIVARGFGALGYTMQLPTEDRYLMQRAGPGQPDGGAARRPLRRGGRARRDLDRRAKRPAARHRLARAMVTEWGMSDRVGVVHFDGPRQPVPRHPDAGRTRPYSEDTAQLIDSEVKQLVTFPHQEARRILREQREILERVTRRLLEKEVMEGDELRRMIAAVPTPQPS